MKKLLIFPIWVFGAFFATSVYATESQTFTMTGERIDVDLGLKILDEYDDWKDESGRQELP